jgi:cation diffusion facilitator family transporter
MAGNTGEVIKALVVNAVIATAKGVAAGITGSGAMLAETLHSFSDCGNQLLLLLGIKQSKRPADDKFPLGYGRAMYFWSFIVALLLFSSGGVFSIYEGIHKLEHPEPVGDITIAIVIIAISILLEGWSTLGNIRVMNQRRGATPFLRYLRDSKDSDLVVVFGENSAAVLGLVLALVAIVLAKVTNDGRYDALGSLAIGLVLVGVAIFLAREIKGLLVGEAADSALLTQIEAAAREDQRILKVLRVVTVQQGPGEVMVACKLQFADDMKSGDLVTAINDFEERMQRQVPEVKWSFVEPDFEA